MLFAQYFPHDIGHMLGLDLHDTPTSRAQPLRAGMVLTVEPGLYLPDSPDVPKELRGIGIRIEDDVVVGADSFEVLTSGVPKAVSDLERVIDHGL